LPRGMDNDVAEEGVGSSVNMNPPHLNRCCLL